MRQNNPISQIVSFLIFSFIGIVSFAQPVIDGDMGDTDYATIGMFTSGQNGFGDDNDLGEIRYFTDNSTITFGISGELTANDNILFVFNFSGYGGRAAGSNLGAGTSGVFTSIGSSALDLEADFALAFNEGNSSSNFYIDAARFGTGGILNDGYIGDLGAQDGTSSTFDVGTQFGGTGNMSIAYHNNFAGNSNKGIEFSIPISAFAGVDNSQSVQVFAVILNAAGFYSNETIPGDPGGSNPGNNFNFSSVAGQDFFTDFRVLPVDLSLFVSTQKHSQILLEWQTSMEMNNDHFVVESSKNGLDFHPIGKVEGSGISYEAREYSFLDESPFLGLNYYRLKQVDYDGKYDYSDIIFAENRSVETRIFPNPAAQSMTVSFNSEQSGSILIYDSQGQLMKQTPYDNTKKVHIGLDGMSGLFMVQIQDLNGNTVLKKRLVIK